MRKNLFVKCKYCKKTDITFLKVNNKLLPIEKGLLTPEDRRSLMLGLVVPFDPYYMQIHLTKCSGYSNRQLIPDNIFMRN